MKHLRWLLVFLVSAVFVSASLSSIAQTDDTAALQQKLYAQFKLTTTTADRSDIVTPGDVVSIQKPGLIMYATASPLPPSNTYKHGRIGQGWSGFGKDMAISMMTPNGGTANDYPHRTFVPEEKCWITGIQVEKDDVLFQLYSDPYDDIRYYANLKIPFPKKNHVPSADDFLPLVAEVLTVVPQDNQDAQQAQQAPEQPPAPALPPPPPAPVAFAPIPPPPPPADTPPPTVSLGQTREQVIANFGEPQREVKLGVKVIFYYKDMKVIFRNGKVTDVE